MNFLKVTASFVLLCLTGNILFAQSSLADSVLYEKTLNNTIAFFRNTIKEKSAVYTGREYIQYGNGIKGHPYFLQDSLQNGTVFYDGVSYPAIPLKYDIYKDVLLIPDYNKSNFIELLTEKINWFQIASHRFVYLFSKKENNQLNSGFYELLLSNPYASIYAKRSKKIPMASKAEEQQQFVQKNVYYIKENDDYFEVSNQASLLSFFKNKKELLKKYVKENKLNFKKDPESTIINTVEYYNTLKK